MRINFLGFLWVLILSAPGTAGAVEALDAHLDALRVGSHIQRKLIVTNTGSMPLCFFPTVDDFYLDADGKKILRDMHPTIWIGPAWQLPNDGQAHAYDARVASFGSAEEAARVTMVRARIELVYCTWSRMDRPLAYDVTGAIRDAYTGSVTAR